MKFRMAKNSLFAVLLRSPWWISAAIAAALVLLTGVLSLGLQRVPAAVGWTIAAVGAAWLLRSALRGQR